MKKDDRALKILELALILWDGLRQTTIPASLDECVNVIIKEYNNLISV